jgi:hypothetical protein
VSRLYINTATRTHDLEKIVHMARSNDDDVVEAKVARLEVVEESQEAMGELVHSKRVFIARELGRVCVWHDRGG